MGTSDWTLQDERIAERLIAEGVSEADFKSMTGRRMSVARKHLYYIRCKEQLNASRRERQEKLPKVVAPKKRKEREPEAFINWDHDRTQRARPTPEMLQAAAVRGMVPRTLTAWVCNDPPPGYSALDRRHDGEEEDPRGTYLRGLRPVLPRSSGCTFRFPARPHASGDGKRVDEVDVLPEAAKGQDLEIES